ncbi:acyltransferase [Staphylococcus chromogenes]|nr:acyltransferase [Staphylococcus chromogenes]
MDSRPVYATQRGFIEPLEGLRAVAAIGIIFTHTAFQTGLPLNSIFARFDFFVPVFFALSAFLLWRRYGTELVKPVEVRRATVAYYLSRAARILPAYLVLVIGVFLTLPATFGAPLRQVVANLMLTQIYVPGALAPGLTHLWSLCVEVAFYLVLPGLTLLMRGRSTRCRLAILLGLVVLSFGWPFLAFVQATPANGWPNLQIFPISYACWFAIGIGAAELEGKVQSRLGAPGRLGCWALALVVAWVAAQPWFGPLGLAHPHPMEFVRRLLAGAVFAALFLLPHAWAAPGCRSRVLSSPAFQHLGRWSYGIFLWHLPVLTWVFPLLGRAPFSGGFLVVSALTVLATIPIAAASYEFVERPAARFLRSLSTPRGSTTAPRDTQHATALNH